MIWSIADVAVHGGEVGGIVGPPEGHNRPIPGQAWFRRHKDGHRYLVSMASLSTPTPAQIKKMYPKMSLPMCRKIQILQIERRQQRAKEHANVT